MMSMGTINNNDHVSLSPSLPQRPILSCFPTAPNWHTNSITSLDPELGLYYYGAVDKIYILDLNNLSYITSWVAHSQRITTLTVLNTIDFNQLRLVSGGDDGKVNCWLPNINYKLHTELIKPIREHHYHRKKVSCLIGTNDGTRVISGDTSGKLVIWNLSDDTFESTQLAQSRIICMDSIQYPTLEILAVGFDNGTILIISLDESQLFTIQYRVTYTGTKPLSLKWIHYDRELILAGSFNDHSLRIWRHYQSNNYQLKPKRILVPSLKRSSHPTNTTWVSLNWCYDVNNQRPSLVFGANSGRLYIWKLGKDGNKPLEFANTCRNTGHNRPIYSIVSYTTNSGSYIITNSQDRRIIIWNFHQQTIQTSISTLGGPARSIDFPNIQPNLAAIGVADSAIRLWNYQSDTFNPSRCSKTLWKTEASSVTRVLFHPELEGVLAFGTGTGLIATFETIHDIIPIQLSIPEPTKLKQRHKGTVIGLQWVKWNRIVKSTEATSYDIEQDDLNQLLGLLQDDTPTTTSNQVQSDSESYALISLDITGLINCNFYKSSPPSPKLSSLFNQSTETIHQFSFAINNPWVALGYATGTIKVFSMPEYSLIYHSTGKLGSVVSLAWSLDETTLAVGHASGVITLHSTSQFIKPGNSIAVYPYPESRLMGHSRDVNYLQWSPHLKQPLLVSCSLDGSTIVWDVVDDKKIATFFTHPGTAALCSRFCPLDTNAIITCADDSSVWVWDMSLYPPVTRKIITKRKEISNSESSGDTSKKVKPLLIKEPQCTLPSISPTKSLQDLLTLTESSSNIIDTTIDNELPSFYNQLWSGTMINSIQELATMSDKQEDLTNWLLSLALSPLAGPEVYSYRLLQTAQQLQTKGYDPRISASLLVAAGQVHEAIDLLTSNYRYTDAITLCKLRFPPGHPQLTELYLNYAKYLHQLELYEESCKYYLLGQQPNSAITTISLRNTRDSLLVAVNLAYQYQDPTLDIRIWRFIVSCLMDHHYQIALDKLNQFDLSLATAAYLILILTDQWRFDKSPLPSDTKASSTLPETSTTTVPSPNPDAIDLDNLDAIQLELDDPPPVSTASTSYPDQLDFNQSETNNPSQITSNQSTSIPTTLYERWCTNGITLISPHLSDLKLTIQRPNQPNYEVTLLTLVHYLQLRPGDLSSEGRSTVNFLYQLLN